MVRPAWFAMLLIFSAAAVRAPADVFELRNGGQVVGQLVERTDDGRYRIRTAEGAEVTLLRSQLQRVVAQDAKALEYQRRSRLAPDTADAHRELVEWCRQQGLTDHIDHHLRRIVDLDPADEDARRSLGFQRLGKRWVSRDELMRQRGLVLHEGKWRTPQDVAIRQRDGATGDKEANWHGKLRLWRGWLKSRRDDRIAEAQAQLAALADPLATPALVKVLDGEEDDWVFDVLLATLGRLDDALAIQTLVDYSLHYEHVEKTRAAEVRADCLDYLLSGARPVSILPYVKALKSSDNVIVNRAGEALGRIGNHEALSPLIDALVTRHKYQINPGGPDVAAGFDPAGGGGGMSVGGNRPQIIQRDEENLRVLRALTTLSGGQNFDYDQVAWRHWYVNLQMRQHGNARRDL